MPFAPLGRLVYLKLRQLSNKGRTTVRLIGGINIEIHLGETGLSGMYAFGLHEFNEMMFAIHLLREGDTFLDVGANLGSYTLLAGKRCGAKVIAVEPSPACVKRLRENCEMAGIKTEIINKAVTSAEGVHDEQLYLNDSVSCENRVSKTQVNGMKAVEKATIDDILNCMERVVLMKMDIEGYEYEALKGAEKALSCKIRSIIIEDKSPETEEILKRYGFSEMSYTPKSRVLATGKRLNGERNSIWVRESDIDWIRRRLGEANKELTYYGAY